MAKKKRGGSRKNAGRKANPVKKKRMTVIVPVKNYDVIKSKTKKLAKAYEDKCRKEL